MDITSPYFIISNYYYILAILMLLASFIPLFIYLMHGREPKIDYNAQYETDLPTDDPPAIVNAVCSGKNKIGIPNLNGFRATILDLIDRNYLLLNDYTSNADSEYYGSLLMEINPNYDPDTLWDFENTVMDLLKEYERDGFISMDLVSESLHYVNSSRFFKYNYKKWKNEVKGALLSGYSFNDSFYNTGDKYLKAFGSLGILWVLVMLKITPPDTFFNIFMLCTVILGLVSAVSLILPQQIAGQWTPYGREYYEKWMNFKKYIEDFSLIKENSPESIKVWNKYLVYATALGAAEGVKTAMELQIPDQNLDSNYLYAFYNYK